MALVPLLDLRTASSDAPILHAPANVEAEQALALADPAGPVDVAGAFQLALGACAAVPAISEAFRTGAGVGWHEQSADVFTGCERFFRAGYAAHLIQDWLPGLPGIAARLEAGGSVADVGCGIGASSVLLASAFPATRVSGSDYHEGSITLAVKRAADLAHISIGRLGQAQESHLASTW